MIRVMNRITFVGKFLIMVFEIAFSTEGFTLW